MIKCSIIFLEGKKEVFNKDDGCIEKDEWKRDYFFFWVGMRDTNFFSFIIIYYY